MGNIVNKIGKIKNLYHAKGCKISQLRKAQETLNINFPEEFLDYVKEFGAISFYGTEWTGLNVEGYINVVDATIQERDMNPNFPTDCFVIENQAIDGLLTIVNEMGEVYIFQYGQKDFLCNSLSEYLDICLARQK